MAHPPFLFQPSTQTYTPGSAELFKRLTGADWIDEMVIPTDASFSSSPVPLSELQLMHHLKPLYEKRLAFEPKLCLHETATGTYTLHAHESIPKGTIVTEYLGEWAQGTNQFSSYRWGPVDGFHFRNCGGMVEDGFPNMTAFYLYDVDRLPIRIVFVSTEDIAAGETLVLNYGMSHSVKTNYHTEYRLDALIDFFRTHSLTEMIDFIRTTIEKSRQELSWDENLLLESYIAKVQYLYQTPSAVLHLLLRQVITIEELYKHYDNLNTRRCILGFPPQPTRRKMEIMESFEIFRGYFSGKRIHDAYLLTLLDKIRIRPLITLLNNEMPLDEILILNECLDNLDKPERFITTLSQSKQPHDIIDECTIFSREMRLEYQWLLPLKERVQ